MGSQTVKETTVDQTLIMPWLLVIAFSALPLIVIILILHTTGSSILDERPLLVSQLFLIALAVSAEAAIRGIIGINRNKHRKIIYSNGIDKLFTVAYCVLLAFSIMIYIAAFVISLLFTMKDLNMLAVTFSMPRLMPIAYFCVVVSFITGLLLQISEIPKKG